MSTQLDDKTELDTNLDNPTYSHIIDRGDDERPAGAIVLEARVMGLELTALCGYKWIPSRDPEKFPVCPVCVQMFEFARDMRGV